MDPVTSHEILEWFAKNFDTCVGVIYEMCGLEDQFGVVMRRNLAVRFSSFIALPT